MAKLTECHKVLEKKVSKWQFYIVLHLKKTQYLYFRNPFKCIYLYFLYWSLPLQAYSKLLSLKLNTKEQFFGASNIIIDVSKSTKLKISTIEYAIQNKQKMCKVVWNSQQDPYRLITKIMCLSYKCSSKVLEEINWVFSWAILRNVWKISGYKLISVFCGFYIYI